MRKDKAKTAPTEKMNKEEKETSKGDATDDEVYKVAFNAHFDDMWEQLRIMSIIKRLLTSSGGHDVKIPREYAKL
uniref:EIF-3c_N domain-containing protein n=1 Tax=Strongyloides papillosus TaxID=174720 RepID=A0A0N5BIL9_STREA